MKITEEAIEAALKGALPLIYENLTLPYGASVQDYPNLDDLRAADKAAQEANEATLKGILAAALQAAAPFLNRMITTPAERDAVPQSAIVRSTGGTTVCRFDDMWGGVFGRTETFLWNDLELPMTVLWEPEG